MVMEPAKNREISAKVGHWIISEDRTYVEEKETAQGFTSRWIWISQPDVLNAVLQDDQDILKKSRIVCSK